jgi:hypothetical protein
MVEQTKTGQYHWLEIDSDLDQSTGITRRRATTVREDY